MEARSSFGELGPDRVTEPVGGHGPSTLGGDQPSGGAGFVERVVEEVGEREHSSFAGEEAAGRRPKVVAGQCSVWLRPAEGLNVADGVGRFVVEGDRPEWVTRSR